MSLNGLPDCRTVTVPSCEPDVEPTRNLPGAIAAVNALALFQMKLRDSIDFTVDFSTWLAANGAPLLTAGAFSVAASSPQTPTFVGQVFSPQGRVTAVLQHPSGAKPGDAYWLDVTVAIGPTQAANSGDVVIPARAMTRRINVLVVNG